MSETTNLKLKKHDNPSTNTEQFDVENYLNKNWDKLDNEVGTARIKVNNLETDNTTNKQDITNIKAKDTEQDKYIAELEAENARLREDLNGLPKGQASGESIDLNDSAEMRCELKISGNSKQETRSGKNLIRNENINVGDDCYWSSYSTFDKETYTMTRKTTNTTESFITYRIGNGIIKNNTQYTISFEAKKNDYVKSFEVLFIGYNSSGIRSKTIDLTKEFQKYTYTFTTDATADYKSLSQIRFDNNGSTESGKEAILTIKNVMLVEGTDTDFEQYGASPSPDYPSSIQSVGDDVNELNPIAGGSQGINSSVIEGKISFSGTASTTFANITSITVGVIKKGTYIFSINEAKNYSVRLRMYYTESEYIDAIIPENKKEVVIELTNDVIKYYTYIYPLTAGTNYNDFIYEKLQKGTTVTPYSPYGQGCINEVICNKNLVVEIQKGYWDNTGVFDTDNNFCSSKQIKVEPGKTYVCSLFDKNKKYVGKLVYTVFDKNKNFIRYSGEDTITIANNEKYVSLRTYTSQSSYVKNNNLLMQLEEGSTVTEYEQHEEQSYIMPVQKEMLEDDYFDWDNEEEVHTWNKMVLTGTENWEISAKGYILGLASVDSVFIDRDKTQFYGYCNYFKVQNTSKTWTNINHCGWNTEGVFWIREDHNIADNIDDFKGYLKYLYDAGTPVIVYYKLQTPTRLAFTDEQKTVAKKLNNARTYKNVTHIYSTDEISPVIDVTYKKDIETLFANTLVEGV